MFSGIQPHRSFLRFQGSSEGSNGGSGAKEAGGTTPEPQAQAEANKAKPMFSLSADRFEAGESSARNAQPENEPPTPENTDAQSTPSYLEALPQALLVSIWDKLSLSHPNTYEKFENLNAVKATSKALRDSIKGYPAYSVLKEQVDNAKLFWDMGRSFRPELSQISPAARTIVIDEFKALPDEKKYKEFDTLGKQLAAFNSDQRDFLVRTALHQQGDYQKACAIAGLAYGFGCLESDQRETMVTEALSLEEPRDRADAIAGLGNGLEHLKDHHETLVTEALSLEPRYQARAIAGLGNGLGHLEADQRKRLLDRALSLQDQDDQAEAIAGLGNGLKLLTDDQRKRLVDRALSLQDQDNQAWAIAGLGNGLEHLKDHHETLVNKALSLEPRYQAEAIAGLGNGLKLLTDDQRKRLVDAALSLQDPAHKVRAIAGLGNGLKPLTDDQRKSLVDAALSLQDPEYQARAIAGLGNGLEHLTPPQRHSLVDATVNLPSTKQKEDALITLVIKSKLLLPEQSHALLQAFSQRQASSSHISDGHEPVQANAANANPD